MLHGFDSINVQSLMKGVVTLIKILYKQSLSKYCQGSINRHSELVDEQLLTNG
jgi:hypothetical protein